MANFNIPNLCGASEELNAASSKIADLEAQIASQIDAVASAAAASIDTALADVKAGLDGLAVDIPATPNVNFQAELTSLVSDFNLSTPQGILQYTSKLAQLEDQFGDALTKAGKSLDSVIADATAAISGGGDVCAVAPNLELPADGEVVEKSQAVKTATADPLTEEVSIVSKNLKSVEKNVEAKVQALSKQINDRTAAGVSTDDVQKAFDTLIATVESEEFKTQMNNDFTAAKAEYSKIAQDPLKSTTITVPQGNTSSVSSTADKTTKVRTVKATTTEDRNTTTDGKTEKTVISKNGFTNRQSQIKEYFIVESERENLSKLGGKLGSNRNPKKYKGVDSFSKIKLKQKPTLLIQAIAAKYKSDGSSIKSNYFAGSDRDISRAIIPVVLGDTNEIALTAGVNSNVSISDLQVVVIRYNYLEKIDPNFKG